MAARKDECAIEGLAQELKVMILSHLDRTSTLYDLVCASPAYHAAYLTVRREILTTVTLRERSWALEIDFFELAPLIEVQICSRYDVDESASEVRAVLVELRKQHKQGRGIILEVEQCITLYKIRNYIPWVIRGVPGDVVARCDAIGVYERSKDSSYRRVFFGEDSAYSREQVIEMYKDAIMRDNDVRFQLELELTYARYPRLRP